MKKPSHIYPVQVLAVGGVQFSGEFRVWEEAPSNEDEVLLELRFDGREFMAATEEGFFDALSAIRQELESEGLQLGCYGCSKNVFPSPMMRSMGYGEKAYLLRMGESARSENVVSIFETGPEAIPTSLVDQERYYKDWLESLGQ